MLNKTGKLIVNNLHYQRNEIEKRLKVVCEMWVDGEITDEQFDEDYRILKTKQECLKKEIEYIQLELDKKTETEKEEEEELEKNYV